MYSNRSAILFVILMLAVSVQAATVGSLVKKGNAAYAKQKYAEAARLYEQAVALPEDSTNPRASIYYNLACCRSLLQLDGAAFSALDRAIRAGYADRRWLKQDKDFEYLRRTAPERFERMLTLCDSAFAREKTEKPPIAVLEYDAYLGNVDIGSWQWDDPNGSKMTELRTTYKLDSVIAPGKTELDKFKLLLNWVSTRWEHSGDNECREANALAILERAAKGEKFRCVEYGITLANCLTALGYPARVVGLQCEGVSYGYGKGHVVAEVWSNDLGKWLLLDGQNNAWWTYQGKILSGAECRDLFIHGKEDSLVFEGQAKDADYAAMKSGWARYFYHLSVGNRYVYFLPKDHPSLKGTQYVLDGDGVLPELFFQNYPTSYRSVSDADFLYPQLNQVRVTVGHTNYKQASDSLKITLENTMPFFDHYMVSLNGTDWQREGAEFDWILEPGVNTLDVKAVNARGVEGKTAHIRLKNNLRRTI